MTDRIERLTLNLKKRQLNAFYAENKAEACAKILDIIESHRTARSLSKDEVVISSGGSQTLKEIGIFDMLGEYFVHDPYAKPTPSEQHQAKRAALISDVFMMSSIAVCENGELVNIDGNGNRLGTLIFGPDKVIIVVGVNKIVKDKDEAMERIKSIACVKNALRLSRKTPCASTGKCAECLIPGNTICAHTVVTRYSTIPDRINVIIVNESLGF